MRSEFNHKMAQHDVEVREARFDHKMAQHDVEVRSVRFDQKMAQRDVEVREARFEDYQAVMDISLDIYNGRDYLPKMYHVFLHDKNSNCFVILLNGRIVSTSFAFYYLLSGYS